MVLDLLWREAQTMEVSSNVYEAITWSSILRRVTLKVWTGKVMWWTCEIRRCTYINLKRKFHSSWKRKFHFHVCFVRKRWSISAKKNLFPFPFYKFPFPFPYFHFSAEKLKTSHSTFIPNSSYPALSSIWITLRASFQKYLHISSSIGNFQKLYL
jgi:hypothetical protein